MLNLRSRTKAYETLVEQMKATKARLSVAKEEIKDLEWKNEVRHSLSEDIHFGFFNVARLAATHCIQPLGEEHDARLCRCLSKG